MRKLTALSGIAIGLVAGSVLAEPIFEERTSDFIDLAGTPTSDLSVKKLALGDFNKDNVEDIVVARRSGNPVLFINVAGVLTQQTAEFASTALATNSYDVALIDADGDTWPDLVFGRSGAVPSLYMNLGEDAGNNWLGFDAGTALTAGAANVTMIDAADFDGDLDTDLVMLTTDGNRRLLMNDGDGSFANETSSRLGSSVLVQTGKIQLGDVENDGDIDIIGVAGSENVQTIFMNDGNGNFPNSLKQDLDLANLTYIPVGADFNGDDIFDYRVYADAFPPTAFMSDGTFTGDFPDYIRRFDADMIGDNGKHGFAHIRDVDGDGDPDYIMSSIEMLGTGLFPDPRNELNEMVITAGVFSGDFDVFADPEWRTEESYDVLFVDINVDGNLDLFIAHEGRFAAYINDAPPQTVEITGFNPVLMQENVANTLSVTTSAVASPTFLWSLGDGNKVVSGSDPFVEHTYSQPGRYQVTVTLTDSAGTDQLSFWQIVHKPLAAGNAVTSSTIVYQTRGGNDYVWNVNPDNDSVTAIDAVADSFVQEIAVGDEPASLALVGSDRLWVTNKGSDAISVIDLGTMAVTNTLDILPFGSRAHGIVAAGGHVYVALEARGEVVKISTSTLEIVGTADVNATPRDLALSADGNTLYVSRFITPPVPGESTRTVSTSGGGEVRLVDPAAMSVLSTIVLPYNDVIDSSDAARGIPNHVRGVALSPDGEIGVVPAIVSNVYRGTFRDGNAREHDRLVRSMLGRLDVAGQQEDYPERFDFDDQSQPVAAVFGPTGNHLFLVHEGSRAVHILDVYANQIIVVAAAGVTPRGIALSPDGRSLFVHNYLDRSVTAYDTTAVMTGVENTIAETAVINTVVVETLDPQILQGKKFFFDAADERLSSQGYMACTSCHDEAGHDGRTWDFSDGGEGLRNTIDLRGRAGTGHGNVHWTANFDEIHDFENDIRHVFDGTGLMSDLDFAATSDTLGPPKAGLSADLDAMAAFTATLTTNGNSPYRMAAGALTAEALAGRELFRNSNCSTCHTRIEFTDSPQSFFHNVGTVDADTGGRLGEPLVNGGLDTPTVRGLWHGAPYLHDGSAATLQEAVLAHTDIATVGFDVSLFTPQQLDDLAAYLLQIDDNEPWAPHPDGNYPPDVINPGNQENLLLDSVSLQIEASDLEGTTLSYMATGLPDGLSIDSGTGLVDGIPTVTGDYSVVISISDSGAATSMISFDWLVDGDTDNDGVLDSADNCPNTPNAAPLDCDTDGDGFGNACDADLDGSGFTNFADLQQFGAAFQSQDLIGDLDCSGFVNFADLAIFGDLFGTVPGE